MSTTEKLLRKGITLKWEIETRQKKLREINKKIAEQAEFKPGSSTGHIAAGGIMAKVTRRQNIKWDQDALAVAHKKMGTELFAKRLRTNSNPLTPVSSKTGSLRGTSRRGETPCSGGAGRDGRRSVRGVRGGRRC